MKVSVIILARDEEQHIKQIVSRVHEVLKAAKMDYEMLVVYDDKSRDKTLEILSKLKVPNLRIIHQPKDKPGFGTAMIIGLNAAKGDVLIPLMADFSDNPDDIVKLVKKIEEGYDMVFGSRFAKGGGVHDYPRMKLLANRLCNYTIKILYMLKTNDITNAFKAYKASAIKKIKPESKGFEITAELPLKLIMLGCSYAEVPVTWHGRTAGLSKLNIWKAGMRYFKVVMKTRLMR